jgi:Predicted membrane protein (DUF2306)
MNKLVLYFCKIFVFIFIFFSVQKMVNIAFPYLVPPFPTNIDFLLNKQTEVRLTHWLVAFYIHITTAVLSLAAGFVQFSTTIMFQYPKIHKFVGKMYVFLILFLAAPTGLLMGFYGEGGIFAQIAFILQALAWWGLTYMAFIKIKKADISTHAAYMLRSYAVGLSAISLRGMSYIFALIKEIYGLKCPDTYWILCHPSSYIFIAWTSWIINWIAADFLIYFGILRYYKIKIKHFWASY